MKQYEPDEVSTPVLRETMDLRERAETASTRGGRRLFCIGRVTSEGVVVWQAAGDGTVFYVGKEPEEVPAVTCAWCDEPMSEETTGGKTSHGIHPECASQHFPTTEDE